MLHSAGHEPKPTQSRGVLVFVRALMFVCLLVCLFKAL